MQSGTPLEPNGLKHRFVHIMQTKPLQTHGLGARLSFHFRPALLCENSRMGFIRVEQLV